MCSTSLLSCCRVRTESRRYQCLEHGCLYIALNLFFCWNRVLAMISWCPEQNSRNKHPKPLQLSIQCLPRTLFLRSHILNLSKIENPSLQQLRDWSFATLIVNLNSCTDLAFYISPQSCTYCALMTKKENGGPIGWNIWFSNNLSLPFSASIFAHLSRHNEFWFNVLYHIHFT